MLLKLSSFFRCIFFYSNCVSATCWFYSLLYLFCCWSLLVYSSFYLLCSSFLTGSILYFIFCFLYLLSVCWSSYWGQWASLWPAFWTLYLVTCLPLFHLVFFWSFLLFFNLCSLLVAAPLCLCVCVVRECGQEKGDKYYLLFKSIF